MDNKPEIKTINIKEFRKKGYLQEVNRCFFHPLGLALSVEKTDEGKEFLSGIWDYRDDPEGIIFAPSITRTKSFKEMVEKVSREQKHKAKTRKKILGYVIQPVNDISEAEKILDEGNGKSKKQRGVPDIPPDEIPPMPPVRDPKPPRGGTGQSNK